MKKNERRRIFAIIGASSGNLVEWFDFYIYAFCAIYFAPSFFPTGDPTVQLMKTAGIFAAGFLMRPLGGWLFGRLADQHGRRTAMMTSVLMMCAGSCVIACLPTYARIGHAAPALLLVVRLCQGLSVGGEYGTSAAYMSEVALEGRRGFFASFQYVTLIGGQLLALFVIVLLQFHFTETQLKAWGWRIPFALGACAALISLWLRRSLSETMSEQIHQRKDTGTLRKLFQYKRALFTVLGLTASGSLSFYTFTTYMQKYLVNTAGLPPKSASLIMTSALFVMMLLQPAFGMLSDRIGRRILMIAFGAFAALSTAPILYVLRNVSNLYLAFSMVMIALVILSLYTSISGLLKAELFPAEVRALGVGLPYAVANAMFGGSAEYIALWMKSRGIESIFYGYVTIVCLMGLLIALQMPDPRRHGYLNGKA